MGPRSMDLGEARLPGTYPVSLGPRNTSCSPLTGHALQTWRALSPRGASWARSTLVGGGEKECVVGSTSPGIPVPRCPFPPLPPPPRPPFSFLSHSSLSPFLFHPQQASQASPEGPAGRTSLTYFGTISAGSAGEATGTLEALGTRRATFTWETSFTLRQRHQGAIRQRRWGGGPGAAGKWGVEGEPRTAGSCTAGRPRRLHRARQAQGCHQGRSAGHSLWDPRGRGLQLRRERPAEQEGGLKDRKLLCPSPG